MIVDVVEYLPELKEYIGVDENGTEHRLQFGKDVEILLQRIVVKERMYNAAGALDVSEFSYWGEPEDSVFGKEEVMYEND